MPLDPSLLDRHAVAAASHDDWVKAALKAAGLASLDGLSSQVDGIAIAPLAAPARGRVPLRMRRPGWTAFQRVDDPDAERAAAQAQADCAAGADGLALVFEGAANAFGRGLPANEATLRRVLDGIDLERTALRIDAHPSIRRSAEWLVAIIEERKPDMGRLRLALGIDTASIFAATGRLGMTLEALAASLPQSMAGFFAAGLPGVLLEADGRVLHNAGADAGLELGHALAVAVQHLRLFTAARQPLVYGAPVIGFALSADQDVFLTVAKLRAARLLWRRVQELCGIETPVEARLHAETSFRNASALDPESNILRGTAALAAAAIGGADSVSVLPHSIAAGLPDAQARRLALMTQLIARDEAHLGLVMDPAAGSGHIEALTDGLCAAAWSAFRTIEAEGGPLRSLAGGHLQARVRAQAGARRAAGGRFVGVNAYVPKAVRPAAVLGHPPAQSAFPAVITCERLEPETIDQLAEGRAA